MDQSQDGKKIQAACKALTARLPDGKMIPRLGQGTWNMGDSPSKRTEETRALQLGIELGMTLIDTAEMYGEGNSEQLIGEAIRDIPREELYLVSKVYPHNAGKTRIFNSCKNSLKRLGVDYLDLYLLHWRGSVPLAETVASMEKLVREGWIRNWGVSNFDTKDMIELWNTPDGDKCTVNQVLYHLGSRGIEFDLLPWMRDHHVPVMAYCPIAQGGDLKRELLSNTEVRTVAEKHSITPIQVLLSFVLHDKDVIAIPKASLSEHVRANAQTALIALEDTDIAMLSKAFPAPNRKTYLDIL